VAGGERDEGLPPYLSCFLFPIIFFLSMAGGRIDGGEALLLDSYVEPPDLLFPNLAPSFFREIFCFPI
jgi:hypothetical protein